MNLLNRLCTNLLNRLCTNSLNRLCMNLLNRLCTNLLNRLVTKVWPFKMSRFYKQKIQVETINGHPLEIEMWCTDEKYVKNICIYRCDICNKEFNEKRRMLLHRNYHR